MFKTLVHKARAHRFIAFMIIAALSGISYLGYQKYHAGNVPARFVLGAVEKGPIVVSISGSGQISSSNQIEVKPKVSGDVTAVIVKSGQEVNAGALLARLDSRDALKAVRDAQASLESANLTLTKLQKPAEALSLLQAEHSLSQAKEAKQKSQDDLGKAYEDGFNTVANAFLGLPNIMAGLDDMLFDRVIDPAQENIDWYGNQGNHWDLKSLIYRDELALSYREARKKYDAGFDHYKNTSRGSGTAAIEAIILETYETTKIIAETIKTANNVIDFVQDLMQQHNAIVPALVATHQTTLDSYTGSTNTYLLNLLSIKRAIEDSKNAIINAERSIAEKTEALAKLKAGTEPLDIASQELAVKQRQNALQDARDKLSDYAIRAPFSGIVGTIDIAVGDAVSSGAMVAVLIAKQQMADISLNEVDAAKIENGQKATLTFDALQYLTLTGQVVEIDALGTVSQGVVTYNITIGLDTQDERVKPGMSVSALIVTQEKADVLRIPNAALKTQRDSYYVEMPDEQEIASALSGRAAGGVILKTPPRRQKVEIGISNDEFTEIVSGLQEGERIIVRMIQAAAPQGQAQPQSNSVRIPGLPSGGGGFRR